MTPFLCRNDGFDVCVFALLFDGFRFRNEITLGRKTEFLKPQFNVSACATQALSFIF